MAPSAVARVVPASCNTEQLISSATQVGGAANPDVARSGRDPGFIAGQFQVTAPRSARDPNQTKFSITT
jgi:hypothetical protein